MCTGCPLKSQRWLGILESFELGCDYFGSGWLAKRDRDVATVEVISLVTIGKHASQQGDS